MATVVEQREVLGIVKHFQHLPETRSAVNRRHLLVDVVTISVCGVLAGADGPVAIAEWATVHKEALRKFLKLPHGIPSHDVIGRVLESLCPQAFVKCFADWLEQLLTRSESAARNADEAAPSSLKTLRHLAVDGKTLRGSHARGKGLGPLTLVSVWATEQGLSLGQLAVQEGSNETATVGPLLSMLDLTDSVVSSDAAGTQKEIAAQIVGQKGDYVLALKANHPTLHAAVTAHVANHMEDDFARQPVSRHVEQTKGHGRIETRTYYHFLAPPTLTGREDWTGLRTLGVAIRECTERGATTCEVRYYLCSLKKNARQFATIVRNHWRIENSLHWSLDVTFREDALRTRARRTATNLAWLRRIALTLLKQHPGPPRQTIASKRRRAAWSFDYLLQVLTTQAS